ncbi:bifunctional DNA primase/polymerase-like protein [Rhodopseudomonas thermotolerans]|uniref:Bifunctional DNA primase/polymerase-like protein n=2 Tax=Rhodopseudomonas TaxID=1073 RepID=A0A336JPX9_9BRAD|nr:MULTISPECIES: AAA family ATPase [Rhodopseudomonas]RED36213.1 bifunctional DNA primase/polymerase-like protein [Rhodopseudomonas pentothenatexigens]REG03586.1 bifunctional DNA primase/polymerase-like protein [Rhodopseudomonas thermotolerans]SSW90773.1 bifunctional DNA primase/polymerase-like protein [Rhodopseudomonas pentothenatexigens]
MSEAQLITAADGLVALQAADGAVWLNAAFRADGDSSHEATARHLLGRPGGIARPDFIEQCGFATLVRWHLPWCSPAEAKAATEAIKREVQRLAVIKDDIADVTDLAGYTAARQWQVDRVLYDSAKGVVSPAVAGAALLGISPAASKRDQAVALAAKGFDVFPAAMNGKEPAIRGANWRKLASSDPQRVAEMWTDPAFDSEIDYNIGIAPRADLLVVDIDCRQGKQGFETLRLLEALYDELPPTYTVRSASGGEHRYYRVDGISDDFPKVLGTDIDLKGLGGYVVAPGSTIDGAAYTVLNDAPIADLPTWVVDHTGAGTGSHRRRNRARAAADGKFGCLLTELDHPDDTARAIQYLTTEAPQTGSYVVATAIHDFGISQEKCVELMAAHWPHAATKSAEELEEKVEHAYTYAQNPLGTRSTQLAGVEFDDQTAHIVDRPPPERRKADPEGSNGGAAAQRFHVRNITSPGWTTRQNYMVRGLLNYGMTAMMSGPSNAGKSPLALDLAAHVAVGKEWQGRKVKRSYVLHCSTEGFTGLSNRMEALRREHFSGAAEGVPFEFVAGSLDLRTSARDANAIVEAVIAGAERFGVPAGLVVIDTLSHALGGGDESNPEHVRAVLKNCAMITRKTGATVLLLHHPTKDASSDYRGSSIMLNDIDLLIKVDIDQKTKLRTVTTPRVKEYAEIERLAFRIKVVELGKDAEGDAITSVVVDWVDRAEAEFKVELTPAQEEALAALDAVLAGKSTADPNVKATIATFGEWAGQLQAIRSARGSVSGAKQALDRSLQPLIDSGVVTKTANGQYVRLSP